MVTVVSELAGDLASPWEESGDGGSTRCNFPAGDPEPDQGAAPLVPAEEPPGCQACRKDCGRRREVTSSGRGEVLERALHNLGFDRRRE